MQGLQLTTGAGAENTSVAVPYFYGTHPLTYLGTLGYDYILNHQTFLGQMMSLMVPCGVLTGTSSSSGEMGSVLSVSYASVANASACAPNLTWSFDETYVAFGGPTLSHNLNVPPGERSESQLSQRKS